MYCRIKKVNIYLIFKITTIDNNNNNHMIHHHMGLLKCHLILDSNEINFLVTQLK
jgi:hypothetical protein